MKKIIAIASLTTLVLAGCAVPQQQILRSVPANPSPVETIEETAAPVDVAENYSSTSAKPLRLIEETIAREEAIALGEDASAPATTATSRPTSQAESKPTNSANEWLAACKSYTPGNSAGSPQVYTTIINDVCANTKLDYSLVKVVAGPTVDRAKLQQYVDSTVFVMSYWQSRTGLTLKPLTIVGFSEFDTDFWKKEVGSRVNVDIEYPGLSTAGGHCGYGDNIADAFCPKNYPSPVTKDGNIVLSLLLGSDVVINRFRHLVPAHEAVHMFQDSVGQSHYTVWYVEGQASLFEMALQRLFYGSTNRIEVLERARTDKNDFNPKNVQDVMAHLRECRVSGSDPCRGFRNGPGSAIHEKIIIDFGIDSYMKLMTVILEQKPLNSEEWMEGLLFRGFEATYSTEWWDWLETSAAPYLVKLYN
tara:strand:- start:73 stop:1329 length:1257 start_codon:yes stop_codon:yes gene_type:complete